MMLRSALRVTHSSRHLVGRGGQASSSSRRMHAAAPLIDRWSDAKTVPAQSARPLHAAIGCGPTLPSSLTPCQRGFCSGAEQQAKSRPRLSLVRAQHPLCWNHARPQAGKGSVDAALFQAGQQIGRGLLNLSTTACSWCEWWAALSDEHVARLSPACCPLSLSFPHSRWRLHEHDSHPGGTGTGARIGRQGAGSQESSV